MKIMTLLFFIIAAVIIFSTIGCAINGSYNNNGNNGNNNNGDKTVDIPDTFESAAELVSYIRIGWNLGNTLDAVGNTSTGFSWLSDGIYANTTVTQMETAWGNPVTTKATITALKDAGFNTIRIPVSWYKTIDSNNVIRQDWMNRVIEVVDYVIDNDMIAILNTHHDEGIFKFTNAQVDQSLIIFQKIWEQIAETFKDYDERLVFEALNEPRTKGVPHEWSGGNTEERNNLNKYYQLFVNIIRNSGGNNNRRILMVNTYAASANQNAMDGLVIPADTVTDRIIVSIHFYEPFNFALNTNPAFNSWNRNNSSHTTPITDRVNRAYNTFVSKGIPVVIGEFGAMNKNNEAVRGQWAEFYVKTAMDKGIPCIWWDNGAFEGDGELFGLINRRTNTIVYPLVLDGLIRGAADWR
jgi:endoglucanase